MQYWQNCPSQCRLFYILLTLHFRPQDSIFPFTLNLSNNSPCSTILLYKVLGSSHYLQYVRVLVVTVKFVQPFHFYYASVRMTTLKTIKMGMVRCDKLRVVFKHWCQCGNVCPLRRNKAFQYNFLFWVFKERHPLKLRMQIIVTFIVVYDSTWEKIYYLANWPTQKWL